MDSKLVEIDPIASSANHLLGVVFARSTSSFYPLAVGVARGAYSYSELVVGKQTTHFVVLAKTKDDANRAWLLIKYLSGSKGLQIFSKGRPVQNVFSLLDVLQCYMTSCACNDYRAHCYKMLEDPLKERDSGNLSISISLSTEPKNSKPTVVERFLFPCKHLERYFRFQKGHPSSLPDQIQAASVERDCDWCPNFNPTDFRLVEKVTIFPDGNCIKEKAE